jgi:Fe2+ or Zn2+ uptake regulation protein
MTAEEVYVAVKAKIPTISEGTVYRNLNILSEEGAVRRLFLPNSPIRYETNPRRHAHMICAGCGKVEDIFLDAMEEAAKEAAEKGVVAIGVDLILSHYCESCQESEKEADQKAGLRGL